MLRGACAIWLGYASQIADDAFGADGVHRISGLGDEAARECGTRPYRAFGQGREI